MKKYIFILLILVSGCGYRIDQRVTKYLDLGYNVETLIWRDSKIIWAHYTFQEWRPYDGGRLYIPLDSVPSVKKRDYELAEKKLALFKLADIE